ncbi:DUF4974 domain-containing protein [Hymenobacter sp. NBH84]|uniref:FecR family protein n=1 Tax=Hymenobacter sp. NBH84 TaxID=2596915 RepID=UPI0016295CA6|nr:FecR domain-containing protein [Hymenobacter sp. NBH84]QNE39839.1 DUF4974 domain-containing protein [Hymenobacter sp. NBH84]
MDAHHYHAFLEKYAAGRHTEAEHLVFRQWLLHATPAQLEEVLDHYAALQRHRLPQHPAPAAVAALEARLNALAPTPAPAVARRPMRWLSVAAMVALLLVAGAAYWLRSARPRPAVAYRQQHTAAGQRARLVLADGSVVHLNGNSTLSYPATFAGNTREVQLRGEAYFEVAKDPAHPFIIHSGRLRTRVVGTSFNVYAYPHARQQEVTVLTGKVVVQDSASTRAVTLRPAQKAVLAASALTVEPAPTPAQSIAWQQGRLVFDQAALPEIVDKLGQRYGVRITLNSEQLLRCRLTVEFGQEPLTDALEILSALTGSTYTLQEQHVILQGAGC